MSDQAMSDRAVDRGMAAPAGERGRFRLGRLNVEVRREAGAGWRALLTAASVALGLGLSAAILVTAGVPAANLVDELLVQTLFDGQNLHAVLFQAAPLMLLGLAAAMAFRVRFWNLGLEGQMIFGGIGATAVSLAEVGPESLRLPMMGLAAILFGIAWTSLPLFLKLKIGVNEIISTLLLNYVAMNLLFHLLYGAWKDPRDGFPHSPAFAPFETLPTVAFDLSVALVVALAAVAFCVYLVARSRAAIYMRFVEASPSAARALGVPVAGVTIFAVLLSGALASLAGFVIVSGQEGRLTQSFFHGYGVSGVLIAFLARSNPLAAAIVATLMATLYVAGQNLQVFYAIPGAMVQLIQALVVICVAASDFLVRHRVRWIR